MPWNGSDWSRIGYDAGQPYPCLHSHDVAWDGQGLVGVVRFGNTVECR